MLVTPRVLQARLWWSGYTLGFSTKKIKLPLEQKHYEIALWFAELIVKRFGPNRGGVGSDQIRNCAR